MSLSVNLFPFVLFCLTLCSRGLNPRIFSWFLTWESCLFFLLEKLWITEGKAATTFKDEIIYARFTLQKVITVLMNNDLKLQLFAKYNEHFINTWIARSSFIFQNIYLPKYVQNCSEKNKAKSGEIWTNSLAFLMSCLDSGNTADKHTVILQTVPGLTLPQPQQRDSSQPAAETSAWHVSCVHTHTLTKQTLVPGKSNAQRGSSTRDDGVGYHHDMSTYVTRLVIPQMRLWSAAQSPGSFCFLFFFYLHFLASMVW